MTDTDNAAILQSELSGLPCIYGDRAIVDGVVYPIMEAYYLMVQHANDCYLKWETEQAMFGRKIRFPTKSKWVLPDSWVYTHEGFEHFWKDYK